MRRSKYEGKFKKGDTYGNWRVLNPHINLDKRSRAYVSCQCSCGLIAFVLCHHLVKGTSTKCTKCNLGTRQYMNNPNWKGEGVVPKSLLSKISSSAARNGIEYKLTPTYVNTLYADSGRSCAISGQPLSLGSLISSGTVLSGSYTIIGGQTIMSGQEISSHQFVGSSNSNATLARINPELGYVEGNVMWVHKAVEPMLRKSKTSSDQFIQMCLDVAQAHSQFRKGNSND